MPRRRLARWWHHHVSLRAAAPARRRFLLVLALAGVATASEVAPVAAGDGLPPDAAPAATLALVSVRAWGWPLPGRPPVLRRFDPPASPYGPGHRGVDLGGAAGDPVLAAGAGVVLHAGVLAGRGVVSIQHANGLRTTYEPLAVSVKAGTVVSRGAVLGRLLAGHAGCPWPACLHWGLRRDHIYLDPLALLRHGPVRLLPLHDPPGPAHPHCSRPPIGTPARAGPVCAQARG